MNAYAVQFNAAAKNLLERLNAKLPSASMSLTDCYSIVMELIEHPQKYGLKLVIMQLTENKMLSTRLNPTSHTSCCDVDTTVGGLCLPTTQLCDDRTVFVFWDAYHTSDAANQVIADRLYADMVSAGAVQGSGNATTRLHPRASRCRRRRRAVEPRRATSKALKYIQQIDWPPSAGTKLSPLWYDDV
uniref:GDSL esterase/lipase n=1 Tax=Oryza barthii TaxID=65489 RepID=A0A0D3HKU5_9ORYZ